jgi:hypothetical protein
MQTNRDFPALSDCLRKLGILVQDSGPNAIALAEREIDAFALREPDLNVRTGHLHILEQELDKDWKDLDGAKGDFAYTIFEFISKRISECGKDAG